jgi:hypothetical protein
MKINNMPEWVKKYKTKGTTIRYIENSKQYVLIRVKSNRVKDKTYPVVSQEYLGIITETGLKLKYGVSIDNLEFGVSYFIYMNFKRELERKFSFDNGFTPTLICATIIYFLYGSISDTLLHLSAIGLFMNVDSFTIKSHFIITETRLKKIKSHSLFIDRSLSSRMDFDDKILLLAHLRNLSYNSYMQTSDVVVSSELKILLDKYEWKFT